MPTSPSVWLSGHSGAWSRADQSPQAGTRHPTLISPAGASGDKLLSFSGFLESLLSFLSIDHASWLIVPTILTIWAVFPLPHRQTQNPPCIYFLCFVKHHCGVRSPGTSIKSPVLSQPKTASRRTTEWKGWKKICYQGFFRGGTVDDWHVSSLYFSVKIFFSVMSILPL